MSLSLTLSHPLEKNLKTLIEQSEFRPRELHRAIIDLSNHYQSSESITPWEDELIDVAYCTYFLPLNFMRIEHVLKEALELGFFPPEIANQQYVDFGAGPGVVSLALENLAVKFKKGICVETSESAPALFQKLSSEPPDLQWRKDFPSSIAHTVHYAFCSFSLNELEESPRWLTQIENLILLEPSTQQAGRRLQEYRQFLVDEGYSIWAPCLHQKRCPHLLHSQKDWCHQRIRIELPNWLQELHSELPMQNQNITYSYLLASRRPAPTAQPNSFRLTGDLLKEKGKTRIMACRGEEREFLSWMKRHGEAPDLERGDIVQCENFETKGNELRVKP